MKISVVVPLYNKKDTILRTLRSIFSQSVQPDEIIVVNDGSTDGSETVVTKLNHLKIRLIHQQNEGVSAARNKGINEAKGDWIAFLDADDEWLPKYIETIYTLGKKYPNCSILATAYEQIDHQGNHKPIILKKLPFIGKNGELSNYFEVASFSHPPLWSSAVVVKKKALQDVGGFPVGIKSGEDLLTWARLAVKYKIGYSLDKFAIYHQDISHDRSYKPHRLHDNKDPVGEGLLKIYKELNHLKIKKDIRLYISHWYKMRASVYLRVSEKSNVLKCSIMALKYNILNYQVYIFFILLVLPPSLKSKLIKLYSKYN